MKKLALFVLLALEVAVLGCATSTTPATTTTSANGNWEATLTGGTGAASQMDFITAFTVKDTNGGSSQPLSISAFSFINSGSCFGTNALNVNGSAALTTSNTNQVTGSLSYTVTGGGVTLSLTGTTLTGTASSGALSGGAVTGTWTVSGGSADCQNVGGNFTMCQNATTCSTTT
jgi:hypothetical protein